ncbi:hypothetical protein [Mycolicibacterium elephantis]|uniref:hypothetical protein n=1 Tax=Mycolicibacterium elephantis TaxID=81858 RepID=UPI000B13B51C|nr:hypothetical protein [Mycolicibacterium elephantis]
MGDAPKPSREELDRVFGDPLPSKEADEDDTSRRDQDGAHERWLRDNVPPHHE